MSVRDIKDRLKTIRMCTDTSVETVIAYWLIGGVADRLLRVSPELFWRPYYNTPLVPMLRAHADQEVVRIHAFLCGVFLCKDCQAAGRNQLPTCANDRCGKSFADGLPLRGLDDLKNHRDVVGHPLTFQLNRAGVKAFVAAKRDRADVRPALIWDIHRSIVDAQKAAGATATILDITIGPYQTSVVDSILRLCLRPGVPPVGEDFLTEMMAMLWEKARVEFEKHPDGQFPRKTDAELKAIFERAKTSWEQSR